MKRVVQLACFYAFSGIVLTASTGCDQVPVDPGPIDPGPSPTSTPTPGPTATPTPDPVPLPDGLSCLGPDPDRQCIGVSLVAYKSSSGKPTLTREEAILLVSQVTRIYDPCNVGFQLERYEAVDPTTVGLSYGAASENELNAIRRQFGDNSTFLVVVPGPWTGRTIAWTTMPGAGPFGAIVEEAYGKNPMTVGHELGHHMGLYHISNSTNLMNAYIGSNTQALSSSQCSTVRKTNDQYWTRMQRQ